MQAPSGFGLSFLATTTASSNVVPSASQGFSFGTATTPSAVVAQPVTTAPGGFLFGSGSKSTPAATGFGFSVPATTTLTAATASSAAQPIASQTFSFGTPATITAGAGLFGSNKSNTQAPSGFGFCFPATTTTAPNAVSSTASQGFSFGTSAAPSAISSTASQGFSFGTSATPSAAVAQSATTAPAGSLFGSVLKSTPSATGFGFSVPATTTAATASTAAQPVASQTFSFGTPATITAGAGLFGSAKSSTQAPSGFGLSFPATTTAAPNVVPSTASQGFTFGAATTTAASNVVPSTASQGFTFGATTTPGAVLSQPATTAPAGGLFGSMAKSTSAAAGFGFPAPAATTLTSATGFTAAQPIVSQPFSIGTSAAPVAPAATSAAITTASPLAGLFTAEKAPTASVAPIVAQPAEKSIPAIAATTSTPATSGNLFGGLDATVAKPPPATVVLTPSLGKIFEKPATTLPVVSVAPTTTAVKIEKPAERLQQQIAEEQKPLTYGKLEELINKWALEVEEQENIFLAQAEQINAWDKILMENGDKILELSDFINGLESEHLKIDHELEFVAQQQSELNQILDQFEKVASEDQDSANGQFVGFYGAAQREEMVREQVMLDSQLKVIGKELEQISDKVECMTRGAAADDPMKQVAQVLSKQMDALQLISEQTSEMSGKLGSMKSELEMKRSQQQTSLLGGSRFF